MNKRLIPRLLIGIIVISIILLFVCIWKLNQNEDMMDSTPNQQEDVAEIVVEPEIPASYVESVDQDEEDLYHGPLVPLKEYSRSDLPRIVCWGDSLTETADWKTAYPDVLRSLSSAEVVNYGLHSDSTTMISVREGAIPICVDACVIPGSKDPVLVNIKYVNTGNKVRFLQSGDIGINPCRIGTVDGKLELTEDGYLFTRSSSGEEVVIAQGTPLYTDGALSKSADDVVVLFSGANDALTADMVPELIEKQRRLLNDIGSEEYVVIGVTYSENASELDAINAAMKEEYQEHFLDIRDYFLRFGLQDAGIQCTEQDNSDIKAGIIPTSLRKEGDVVHGTVDYYRELGEQVYRKLQYLGYLPLEPRLRKSEQKVQSQDVAEEDTTQRIICWGDSLTEGTGGDKLTYPIALQQKAESEGKKVIVKNYGVYAEESSLIAARAGGNRMTLRDAVTIPAGIEPVSVVPISDMVGYEMLLVFGGDKKLSARGSSFIGDDSVNPCLIAGVEGDISIDPATGERYFTRRVAGDAVSAPAGSEVQFWAMRDKRADDILVLWTGNNDSPTAATASKLIEYQKSIINYTGTDKYVIINLAKIDAIPEQDAVNAALKKAFGDHVLDMYTYLTTDAMDDAGLPWTEQDKKDVSEHRVPTSLRVDDACHFTDTGYRVVGEKVYQKLCELGYL